MLTQDDLELLDKKGISEDTLKKQLLCFENGFPYLKVLCAATHQKGISVITEDKREIFIKAWKKYLEGDHSIIKFVPASGAASRMFKNLFEFVDKGDDDASEESEKKIFENITRFAFEDELNQACLKNDGKSLAELSAEGKRISIAKNILDSCGLNYGALPKGLLLFHKYADGARTPFEEHIVEGAKYAKNNKGQVNLHFTVSPEHMHLFETLYQQKTPVYSYNYGAEFNVSFSVQKTSTDTVAADSENKPFRVNGKMFFRPGGHGALIENLNDIDADVVFIKNIDNVVPDPLKQPTIEYKTLIAGALIHYQSIIHSYLKLLDSKEPNKNEIEEMLSFCENELCLTDAEGGLSHTNPVAYLKSKFNRPIRVCGMVKNEGEPGGGPFICYNADGTTSPQILESSQFDKNDEEQMRIAKSATHFNPVDLVCSIKNYKGEKFDLTKYIDHNTGFISLKSKNGKDLKALELPGLWNGAMSDWNTFFVEVPKETFNPVKTLEDLLREEHQI